MKHYVRVIRNPQQKNPDGSFKPPIAVKTGDEIIECWGVSFKGDGVIKWVERGGAGPFNNACWLEIDGEVIPIMEPPSAQ